MGLLDRKITYYVSYKQDDIEGVANYLEKEIGSKYKVKLNKKGGLGKQMISGSKEDYIFIEKNGYHRCSVLLTHVPANQTEAKKDEMRFNISRLQSGGFIGFLDRELGMIGSFIISLIYGKATEFYEAIHQAIVKEYDVEERELNVGVSALFKKK